MKNRSHKYHVIAMGAIAYLVIIVCVFVLNRNFDKVFWVSFSFLTLSYVLCGIGVFLNSGAGARKYFLNIESYQLLWGYLVIENIIALIWIITNNWFSNLTFTFLSQLVVLGGFLIFNILTIIRKNEAEAAADHVRSKKSFIEDASMQIREIAFQCEDEKMKKLLSHVAEELHYSPPCMDEELIGVENEIEKYINHIQMTVSKGEYDDVEKHAEQILLLIKKRNRLYRRK